MDSNTKSLLKHTILGLLGGGAVSALYAAHTDAENKKEEQKYQEGVGKNQIVVPLSHKHFLKALGKGKTETKKETPKQETPKQDVSALNPMELAALKRAILRNKTAEAPTTIKGQTTSTSSLSKLRKNTSNVQLKDSKGKFATAASLDKQAGSFFKDIKGTMADGLGLTVGSTVGILTVKAVADRLAINRKKKQVEKAKRMYANMINNEVNDDDEPYYVKSSQDRGLLGTTAGIAGLTGIATAGLSGLLIYKIMENRRKASEAAADKDSTKYPAGKTIKFQFK